MALNKPKFEDESGNTPAPAATAAPASPPPAAASSANVPATVTPPKAGLPVVSGGAFKDYFKQYENAFPPMEFGTLPRLLGVNGAVFIKGNNTPDVSLGEKIEIDLHSFHDEWVITPGGDDKSERAKAAVKYSRDGKTVDGTGQNVDEYLKYLIEVENFKDAKKKRYVHLLGTLVSAAKPTDQIGNIVDVTIAPDGVKPWENHRIQTSSKITQRRLPAHGANRVTITAQSKSSPGRNWVALIVGPGTTPVPAEEAAA